MLSGPLNTFLSRLYIFNNLLNIFKNVFSGPLNIFLNIKHNCNSKHYILNKLNRFINVLRGPINIFLDQICYYVRIQIFYIKDYSYVFHFYKLNNLI